MSTLHLVGVFQAHRMRWDLDAVEIWDDQRRHLGTLPVSLLVEALSHYLQRDRIERKLVDALTPTEAPRLRGVPAAHKLRRAAPPC